MLASSSMLLRLSLTDDRGCCTRFCTADGRRDGRGCVCIAWLDSSDDDDDDSTTSFALNPRKPTSLDDSLHSVVDGFRVWENARDFFSALSFGILAIFRDFSQKVHTKRFSLTILILSSEP